MKLTIDTAERTLTQEVEGDKRTLALYTLGREGRIFRQLFGQEYVGSRGVFGVEVVSQYCLSERMIGRCPRRAKRIVPSIRRGQLRSPPP